MSWLVYKYLRNTVSIVQALKRLSKVTNYLNTLKICVVQTQSIVTYPKVKLNRDLGILCNSDAKTDLYKIEH